MTCVRSIHSHPLAILRRTPKNTTMMTTKIMSKSSKRNDILLFLCSVCSEFLVMFGSYGTLCCCHPQIMFSFQFRSSSIMLSFCFVAFLLFFCKLNLLHFLCFCQVFCNTRQSFDCRYYFEMIRSFFFHFSLNLIACWFPMRREEKTHSKRYK